MLVKGWPNVWVYDRYMINDPSYHIYNNYSHGFLEVYLVNTSHFLVLPQYYSTSGGAMRLSFSENLMNYYYKEPWYRGFLPWPWSCPRPRPHPWVWDDIAFTSGNGLDPIGQDWWFLIKSSLFCLATRRHDINLDYFINLPSRYCCCRSTFEAWNVVKNFLTCLLLWFFFLHNFNWELILKSAELYSLTVLKSYNLKCIQSYQAYRRMTIFLWSYLFFKLLHE